MIIRRRHTGNFTTIGNELFGDERLQLDEVGILTFLLSRPDNWEVRRPALMRRWRVGRDALRRIVTNLVKYGWATACRKRLGNGTFYTVYEIRDQPGPTLTDDEVKKVFSLVSSEGSVDEVEGDVDADAAMAGNPPWSADNPQSTYALPDTADPPLVLYKNITNPETTKSERELARARERHALNLPEFKRRYPTTASDDQGKIDEEWFKLELDEAEPALAGIVPFLEKLKRDMRSTTPAAWKYLKEKRWTLLEQAQATAANPSGYPRDSTEAKAVMTLYSLAGALDFFVKVVRKNDVVYYSHPVPPQLAALAQAPPRDDWVPLERNQAAAWETMIEKYPTVGRRKHLREGDPAPWPWPPSVEGKLYTSGPPPTELSDQYAADFK